MKDFKKTINILNVDYQITFTEDIEKLKDENGLDTLGLIIYPNRQIFIIIYSFVYNNVKQFGFNTIRETLWHEVGHAIENHIAYPLPGEAVSSCFEVAARLNSTIDNIFEEAKDYIIKQNEKELKRIQAKQAKLKQKENNYD